MVVPKVNSPVSALMLFVKTSKNAVKATDSLERAVNALTALTVADAKGRALVPLWLADYRTHISDRRAYSDDLRNGVNEPFSETVTEGLPISEKIATFAADNAIPSCAPPIDLSV